MRVDVYNWKKIGRYYFVGLKEKQRCCIGAWLRVDKIRKKVGIVPISAFRISFNIGLGWALFTLMIEL